jgi:phosphatidylserine decarboxylase
VTPYSKNKRVITIIDTDVPGGTQVGVVAMVEVVALMIGDIAQCYSEKGYDDPVPIGTGLFVKKGCPKSLFRPGSSTVVLIFQRRRVDFANDIVWNMRLPGVESILSSGFSQPLVETDVLVRDLIGTALQKPMLIAVH